MMIQLLHVKEWLKTAEMPFEHYFIGKLSSKQQKSLGVYDLPETGSPFIAIGGLETTTYRRKQVSLLIHWNKNQSETEETADALFEWLMTASPNQIGGEKVYFIGMLVPQPQLIGTDDDGIYEAVIEFEIYYERSHV